MRTKLVELGLAESTAKIDVLATAVKGIANNGNITAEVKEGETYTIPKGYHNGSGTVAGVAGGGNYLLQSKTVTPTKSQQSITPDAGNYGLSDVTVNAIPENYQDVSSVDAVAANVLANKRFVASDGTLVVGTMANNGAVAQTLDTTTTEYTVPAGYHDGTGKVSVVTETKAATPTEEAQTITPTAGKVLSSVTINAIPDNYAATDDATAVAANILEGATAYSTDGEGNAIKLAGTMRDNGPILEWLYVGNASYQIPSGYHDGIGSVNISLEKKSITPTKSVQEVTPSEQRVLSQVTVAAIPAAYQDVSLVDAGIYEVLSGSTFVDANGAVLVGAMPNNGAINGTIDGLTTTEFEIPAGYTTGGVVGLTSDIEDMLAAI